MKIAYFWVDFALKTGMSPLKTKAAGIFLILRLSICKYLVLTTRTTESSSR